MAAAKAAIRASQDFLHGQELKCITGPIPAASKTHQSQKPRNCKWLQTHQVTSMELASLIWNSDLRDCRTPPNLLTHCDGCGATFSIAHGIKCKTGGIVIQPYDQIKLELQDLSVEETEGMCLHQQKNVVIFFLWISESIKLIAFWPCVSRFLMHHPTFIWNRKQSFFPICTKRRGNTSKPAWTNAGPSLPLWFQEMEWLEM